MTSRDGWIKCSERRPESKPGKWSKEVRARGDSGEVFILSCMGDYWQRSTDFINSASNEIIDWQPIQEDSIC